MIFADRHDWRAVVRGVVFLLALLVTINVIAIGAALGKDFLRPPPDGARPAAASSRDTTRLPLRLQIALAYADAACGIKVVSTWRRGAVIAGTGGKPSLHRSWRAADFTTEHPDCVRRALRDWRGCMSIDYARAKHFHIDTSGNRTCRFVHGGAKKRRAVAGVRVDQHRSY